MCFKVVIAQVDRRLVVHLDEQVLRVVDSDGPNSDSQVTLCEDVPLSEVRHVGLVSLVDG